jgi:hypothetical protein
MVQIWCHLTYFYLSYSLYYYVGDVTKTQVYFSKILRTLIIDHPYVYCNLENLLVIPPHSKYNKKEIIQFTIEFCELKSFPSTTFLVGIPSTNYALECQIVG